MLESLKSNQIRAVPAAVPFPVSFKEQNQDRLFKQVAFPGKSGSYRIRTIGADLRSVSTVSQKSLNTGLSADGPSGQLFRVKAFLSKPDTGVSESYWLTMKNSYYGGVQAHNQYRMRGVSLEKLKSDWVYSEARDETNHIIIYELLYDLLNIIDYIEDDNIEAFLSLIAKEAYRSVVHKENVVLLQGVEPDESVEYNMQDSIASLLSGAKRLDESVMTHIKSAFEYVASKLQYAFREDFLANKQEFLELMRVYRIYEKIQQRPSDVVSVVLEMFLEEYIDRIVQSSNLEVLFENDENKAIYLEGRYELDVKAELLKAAFAIMPHDSFVFRANGTVKLFTEPVSNEQFDYRAAESVCDTLAFVSSQIKETLQIGASEEIYQFLRLLIQEIYLPYALVDLRSALVSIDLEDAKDENGIDDRLVEYDLIEGDYVYRSMLLRDILTQLLVGGDSIKNDIEAEFVDRFIDHFIDQRHALVSYELAEYMVLLSEMGERFMIKHSELFEHQDSIGIEAKDYSSIHPALQESLTHAIDVMLDSSFAVSSDSPVPHDEVFDAHYAEIIKKHLDLKCALMDYYCVLAHTGILLSADSPIHAGDEKAVLADDGVFTVYKPHLKDTKLINPRTHRAIHLHTELSDRYRLPGKEEVMYALGDVTKQGWPIGVFVLGTNTLKGQE